MKLLAKKRLQLTLQIGLLLLLLSGIAVAGILVKRSQDTRQKASGNCVGFFDVPNVASLSAKLNTTSVDFCPQADGRFHLEYFASKTSGAIANTGTSTQDTSLKTAGQIFTHIFQCATNVTEITLKVERTGESGTWTHIHTCTTTSSATPTPSPSPTPTTAPQTGDITFCVAIEQCGKYLTSFASLPKTTFSMKFSNAGATYTETPTLTTASVPNTTFTSGLSASCVQLSGKIIRDPSQSRTEYTYSPVTISPAATSWGTPTYNDGYIDPTVSSFTIYGDFTGNFDADGYAYLTSQTPKRTVVAKLTSACTQTTATAVPTAAPTSAAVSQTTTTTRTTTTGTLTATPTPTPTPSPAPTTSGSQTLLAQAQNTPTPTPTVAPTNAPLSATPTPSPTPTTAPTASPVPQCNSSCVTSGNCPTGMTCYLGLCRTSSCTTSTNCLCTTPTPIPTATPIVLAQTQSTTQRSQTVTTASSTSADLDPALAPVTGSIETTIGLLIAGIALILLGIFFLPKNQGA